MSQSRIDAAQKLLDQLTGFKPKAEVIETPVSNSSSLSSISNNSSTSSSVFSTNSQSSTSSAMSIESKIGTDYPDISKNDFAAIDYLKGQSPEVLNTAYLLAVKLLVKQQSHKAYIRPCALLLCVNAYSFEADMQFSSLPTIKRRAIYDEIKRRTEIYQSYDQIQMLLPAADKLKNEISHQNTSLVSSPVPTDEKQSKESFLTRKEIPLDVIDDIASYLTTADMSRAMRVSKGSSSTLFFTQGSNSYEKRIAEELLRSVLYGNEARVLAILNSSAKARAALFIEPEKAVNDHIERIGIIRPIKTSPFMAIRGACDPYMLKAVAPFLDEIPNGREQARVCLGQFVETKEERNPFNFFELVLAIYVDPCTEGKVMLPATEEKLAALKAHYAPQDKVIKNEVHFAAKDIYRRALLALFTVLTNRQLMPHWNDEMTAVYSTRVLGLLQSLFSAYLAQTLRIGWYSLCQAWGDEGDGLCTKKQFSRVKIAFSTGTGIPDIFDSSSDRILGTHCLINLLGLAAVKEVDPKASINWLRSLEIQTELVFSEFIQQLQNVETARKLVDTLKP